MRLLAVILLVLGLYVGCFYSPAALVLSILGVVWLIIQVMRTEVPKRR